MAVKQIRGFILPILSKQCIFIIQLEFSNVEKVVIYPVTDALIINLEYSDQIIQGTEKIAVQRELPILKDICVFTVEILAIEKQEKVIFPFLEANPICELTQDKIELETVNNMIKVHHINEPISQ